MTMNMLLDIVYPRLTIVNPSGIDKFCYWFNDHVIYCQTGTILRVKGEGIGNYARMIGINEDYPVQIWLSTHLSNGSTYLYLCLYLSIAVSLYLYLYTIEWP